ncbi:uncharacterized protein [Nicotiana tomentosiformis]|uniref:uncharacterized protein n=1 Tax=Nicotiana tomentosiformis TaxID=4098 RepID=UPI00388C8A31
MIEENRILKQQRTEMCQAWANGQGPPLSHVFPEVTPISATTTPVPLSDQSYPSGFSLYPNCTTMAGTSVARSQSVPWTTNEATADVIPVFTIPQLTSGLASHKSIAFKDLCMFPDVRLPFGLKTPKFEKYDGNRDPISHLKRYCNRLRGAGRNEELLIAYFGESLPGIASEWFMDQDTSHWHVWDDMARAFVKQFQYNIDIAPDRNSLSNLKKKPTESFREYTIKWREQAARVKPPMDDHELITVFLQAQEPDYF